MTFNSPKRTKPALAAAQAGRAQPSEVSIPKPVMQIGSGESAEFMAHCLKGLQFDV
jgi:hypothetical protein